MTFYFYHKRADFWLPNLGFFFHFSASLRTTVPLVSYIRISLRFWYYTSLSTCCENLDKKIEVTGKTWEKEGVKLLRDLTEKSCQF